MMSNFHFPGVRMTDLLQGAVQDAHLREIGIGSEVVYAGSFLQVRRDTVRQPDGRIASREFANTVYGKDNPYGWSIESAAATALPRA